MVSLLSLKKKKVKLDSATIFFKNKGKIKIVCDKNESIYHSKKRNSNGFIEEIEN